MDLTFLFRRPGNTVTSVATAAGVNPSTASRWKDGTKADWIYVCRLYARGIISIDDLRAAGLAIPPPSEVTSITPAPAPVAIVPVVDAEAISVEDRRPAPLGALKAVGCVVGVGFLLGLLS